MKKQPLKISFCTQKGGVGKSTMTTLLSSILHYRMGYNVMVMDCDFPQHSISKMRERDKKNVMGNELHKRMVINQFQTINKKGYPIIRTKPSDALEKAAELVETSVVKPDVIFFDLPGTANTEGVLTTLKAMDLLLLPMTADRLVVESTLSFAQAFISLPETESANSQQVMWLYWNQVDGREKTSLYESYEYVIKKLGLSMMESRLSDSKRFRKESDYIGKYVFRSTLLPAHPRLMKSAGLDLFVDEFIKISNL